MPYPSPPPIEVQANADQPLGMPAAEFLALYWQKHPLLVRQAFPRFEPPLAPDDLAGLACEDGVLARLIVHHADSGDWRVTSGPLAEADFARTPERDWTLLVQDVDKWDADVAALLDRFDFLPTWRVDDVMVSYAEPGGGVGAHVDQYDVFLLQGLGERAWAISTDPDAPIAFRPDLELKQLVRFAPTHRWRLAPGDMLYLPPGVPHDGVAVGGPCMTFSIGMRAPAHAELIGDLADYIAERLDDSQRYADPDLAPVRAVGEIDAAAFTRLRANLPLAAALDDDALRDWFGRFITRYRSAHTPATPSRPVTTATLRRQLDAGAQLLRHPYTRLAWSRGDGGVALYANGRSYPADAALATALCGARAWRPDRPLAEGDLNTLAALVSDGHLVARKPGRR